MPDAMSENKVGMRSVSRGHPCELCEGHDGCSRGDDDLILCRRRTGPQSGYVYLGQSKRDNQWALYRREGDPHLNDRPRANGKPSANGHRKQADADPMWGEWMQAAERALTPALRAELAQTLGLPESVLAVLRIGHLDRGPHRDPDTSQALGGCWVVAEVDGTGRVVGANCRYRDGRKKAMPRGGRGLTVPAGWQDRGGPVFLVEGASDVLALTALGLAAIGRPSCTGGVEQLAELLHDLPHDRRVVVVAEYDPKPDGKWPGRDGAMRTAAELQRRLVRPVQWVLPPDGAKDMRQWALAQNPDHANPDEWHDLGRRLRAEWEGRYQEVTPPPLCQDNRSPRGLATTRLDTIRPVPVRWLVPSHIPLGKLVLVAGDGGHGKSSLTLHLATALSQGWPCLGMEYDRPLSGESLLIQCEDDDADTVVPRLVAAGADLTRIHRVDGIRDDQGKVQPFSLRYYEQLEQELEDHPDIRLVVIDPAGAYIGATGVDEHKDADVRSLLGPLAELAARRQVTIILVKHLNKGATAKAVHKVSGSTGYVNAVRAAFVVVPHPEEEPVKLLLPLKFNVGPKPVGLSYRMTGLTPAEREAVMREFGHLEEEDRGQLAAQLFRIVWAGTVDMDADTALAAAAKQDRGPGKAEQAAEWLVKFLKDYAYPSTEVIAAGKEAGFNRDTLFRAKKSLDSQVKASNRGRFGGVWHWGIGDPSGWTVRVLSSPQDHSDTRDTIDTMDAMDGQEEEDAPIVSIVSMCRECPEGSTVPDSANKDAPIASIVSIVSNTPEEEETEWTAE